MFAELVESRRRTRRTAGGALASVAAHALVVALAVYVTARHGQAEPPDPRVVVVPLPTVPVAPPEPNAPRPAREAITAPATLAPPAGPVLPTVDVVLPGIPPVPPLPGALPTRETFGSGAAPAEPGTSASGAGDADAPYAAADVERLVAVLPGAPAPRYPEVLRAAGVEGTVRVRFVVDTLGRVDAATVRVVDATRAAFADAVRSALLRTRFRPAEAGGRRVRQLVEQSFVFALDAGAGQP